MGRTILGKTHKRARIGRLITQYVAERVLERERMIEGDWLSMKAASVDAQELDTLTEPAEGQEAQAVEAGKPDSTYYVLWFLIGIALVVGTLAAAIGLGEADRIVGWVEAVQNLFHGSATSATN